MDELHSLLLDRALNTIRAGQLVAIPTETVYGLGERYMA